MRVYFLPTHGRLSFTETPEKSIKNKIDKLCQFNAWNTLAWEDDKVIPYDSTLHGYIEDNKCYDNSYYFYNLSMENYKRNKELKRNELKDFTAKIMEANSIIDSLFNKIKLYKNSKNLVVKTLKLINDGFIKTNNVIRGSKRKRRLHKKANIRRLTDYEIKKYTSEVEDEKVKSKLLLEDIKAVEMIESCLFKLGDTPEGILEQAKKMNGRHNNYKDTIFIAQELQVNISKLDEDIYNECLRKYKEVLLIDNEERVEKNKNTKHKSRVFISNTGKKQQINNDNEQKIRL